MRIVQAVVAVAPPALILWWGGLYLRDAANLLLAPGTPVAFDYKSPEGPIRLWADTYQIDPDRGTLRASGLTATRVSGLEIASVASVEASGLRLSALRPQVVVRNVRVRLERDTQGFDLARLFPKREGPPSKIPYSVTVLDGRVYYVDRTFDPPLRQVAETRRAVVDGIGDDWRAEGRLRLPGIGVADARAQSLPNVGTTLDLNAGALRLETLAPALLPGLRVASLVARGPVRIDLPKQGDAQVAATLRAEAKGVRYREYEADSVVFDGRASGAAGKGTVLARLGDVRVQFEGSVTRERGGGYLVASVPSPGSLPLWARKFLPAKTDFRDAAYRGWLGWEGMVPRLQGEARAARAAYGRDAVEGIRADVAYNPQGIQVRGLTARWKGAPLAGDGAYDPKSGAIQGVALAPQVEIAELASRIGRREKLSGRLGGEALVSGTLDRPEIEGRVSGSFALGGRPLGDVEARGAWLAGAARVDRLRVSGPLGAIVAGGTIRPDGTLDFKAEARGIRIERLVPDAKGLVSANLNVGGTLRDPKAKGRVEAYRVAYQSQAIPAAGFDLTADRRRVDLRLLTAVRGTTRLRGRVGASLVGQGVVLSDPRTWLLDGRFSLTGVQATEIPGAEGIEDVAGLFSMPRADLSGRVGSPILTASLEGDGILVRGIRMESMRADARVDRHGMKMSNLEVFAAGGRLAGTGAYDFASQGGEVDLTMADVQLSRLLNDLSEDVLVDGTISAPRIHLALRDGKPVGQAEGTLSAVKVNGVLAGDGNWALDATGERIEAKASVGRLDPTLRALDATAAYNVQAGSLAATVQAKDLPLQAVVAAAQARRTSSESEAARLATVQGDLSGTVEAVRTKDGDLKIDASDLQASGIRYEEIDYGTLTATTLVRRGGRWTLTGGRLEGSAGTFAADGWVQEDGGLDLQASGDAVRLSAFSPFVADLAQFSGIARFALAATGDVDRPVVAGSAAVDGLFSRSSQEPLSIALEKIAVRDGKSEVAGVLRYGERFGGLFTASTDWAYRSEIKGAAIQAKIDLGALQPLNPVDPTQGLRVEKVNLVDIPILRQYLDARGGGTMTGSFAAAGTVGEPKLTGGLELIAERLGITFPGPPNRPVARLDDTLQNVRVNLGFDERNAPRLDASVGFARGGVVTAMATLGDLGNQTVFQALSATRDWKGLPVEGRINIPDDRPVTVRQTVAGGTTTATVKGTLRASGKAVTPDLTGAFVITNFESTLPSLEATSGDSTPSVLDPNFDLTFVLGDAGRFRTATADLYLDGDLTLKGPLSNPRANAELVTERGSIRLPGGLVRVDKGGQISFSYRRPLAGGPGATAQIDLQGRSQVTLARQGFGTQHYDVMLDIQGDLLRENGLQFDATSDPPDLNKDEILNALGGTELITGISAGGASTEKNVRNALIGFALPGLLDTFTGGIARGLGLDYVSLEYNEYDQATVAFARSLGPDFSFQGRQQVGTPTPGYRSIYDLRLSYNPRRLLPKLSRFSFTVGTDQDRPWKVSVEYGTRFGQRGGKPAPKHVLFPRKTN